MDWYLFSFFTPLLIGTGISLILGILAWVRPREPGARTFSLLMFALAIWSLGYGLELLATDLDDKVFWHKITYLGIPLVPATWLAFMLRYSNPHKWLTWEVMGLLALEPLFIMGLIWYPDTLNFLWQFYEIRDFNGIFYLYMAPTPLLFAHIIYSYLLLVWGIILYIRLLSRAPSLRIRQVSLLLLAILMPYVVHIFHIFHIEPFYPIDLAPIASATTGASAGWYIFRFQLLDLWPIARKTLLESLHDGVIVLNRQNRILSVNPAAQRLINQVNNSQVYSNQFGKNQPNDSSRNKSQLSDRQLNDSQLSNCATDDFHHLHHASIQPNETMPIIGQPLDKVFPKCKNLSLVQEELRCTDLNGSREMELALRRHELPTNRQYIEISISPLCNYRNRLSGWLVMARDVTQNKKTERALRENEAHYRHLIDVSPDVILVTELDGTIVMCNQQAKALYGLQDTDEILGRQIREFVIAEERSWVREHQQMALKTEKMEGSDFTMIGTDGLHVPTEVNIATISDADEDPFQLIYTIRDMSERKRNEDALRQTQKLESIGLLAGGVAHDFNNLLTGMLAQNSLSLARLDSQNQAWEHVQKAVRSTERAADLTRQLLAYAGKGQFRVEPVDINEIILENVVLLETAVRPTVELQLSLSPHLPTIRADRGQIQQIIMNLVINAAEAIPNGHGHICIVTESQEITSLSKTPYVATDQLIEGDYVSLKVRDTGIGMEAETLARIFDPFFSTKPKGRGLGLSATIGIIRSHKGGLHVSSHLGQGTKFEIVFPAYNKPRTKVLKPRALPNGKLTGSVLIIDDEEPVRDALIDILTPIGLRIITAEDGRQGIERFLAYQSEIDMVLLDIQMPVMDGQEALQVLREIDPKVKVILSSGYSESAIAYPTNGHGHTTFIQKPYDVDTLIDKVRDVLER